MSAEPPPKSTQDLLAECIASMDETYELVYINHYDTLSPLGVRAVVENSDSLWEEYYSQNEEWESENRHEGAHGVASDLVRNVIHVWRQFTPHEELEDLIDRFRLDGGWDELIEEIMERDTSEWISQLAKHTPPALLRVLIDEGSFGRGDDEIAVVERLGLKPIKHNLLKMRSILDGMSSEGVECYMLFSLGLQDILRLGPGEARLGIVDPWLIVQDDTGYEEAGPFKGLVPIKRSQLALDKYGDGEPYDRESFSADSYWRKYAAGLEVLPSDAEIEATINSIMKGRAT